MVFFTVPYLDYYSDVLVAVTGPLSYLDLLLEFLFLFFFDLDPLGLLFCPEFAPKLLKETRPIIKLKHYYSLFLSYSYLKGDKLEGLPKGFFFFAEIGYKSVSLAENTEDL